MSSDSSNGQEIKEVPLPERVAVRVDELHKLREHAAMLAALKMAKAEEWHGWSYAKFLYENDPEISDIRQGWKSVLGHRTDRGTGNKRAKENSETKDSDRP